MRTVLIMTAALSALPLTPAEAGSIFGRWLTEDRRGKVEIYRCGAHASGRIMNGGRYANKLLLWDFSKSARDAGVWEGGKIANPRNGDSYRAVMSVEADGRLKVRAYLGVSLLEQNQYWTRIP